jgi:tripartite-type tricarboxylate transporter receptor subunit TctC
MTYGQKKSGGEMRKIIRIGILLFHAFVILAWPVSGTAALSYPTRPVRLIVPTTPGGATDLLARVISNELTKIWGQQVIVDNRPGGHGIIAMELLANAPTDGHTLLMGNIGVIAINAGLGALKNQVQHFSERMLHGKNLQSIEY